MREILFKGKRKCDGEWVYGYYVNTHGVPRIIREDFDGFYCEEEINHKTLCQYTGLKDINGNKVFEFDIVRCKMKYKGEILSHMGVIVYDNDFGSYGTKNDAGITLLYNHYLNTFEIIGNIHDKEETK